MKAIRVHQIGDPQVLTYEEVPKPTPEANQVLVKIEAIGVNFIDTYQRSGAYKMALPFIPGQEAAGLVEAIGANVTTVKPGDRVAYSSIIGAYAEWVVIPADRVVPVPEGISAHQAAAVLVQGMTAHYLAFSTYPLSPGETVLVHAAAGGLGLVLIQIAKQRGARVIGTASTDAKVKLAQEFGADYVINYTTHDFEVEVKRLTEGKGVDVVYDSVGKSTFDKSLNCLRRRGMMVLCGQSSGAVPPLDPQILNAKGSLFLTRPTLAHYIADRSELLWRANDLFDWMRAGKLRVRIDRTFPLADASSAHRYLESRQAMGKLLLIP